MVTDIDRRQLDFTIDFWANRDLFGRADFTGCVDGETDVAQFDDGSGRPGGCVGSRLRFLPIIPNRIPAEACTKQSDQDDPFFNLRKP